LGKKSWDNFLWLFLLEKNKLSKYRYNRSTRENTKEVVVYESIASKIGLAERGDGFYMRKRCMKGGNAL